MKHLEDTFHKAINQYLTILQNQGKIDKFTYNASGEKRTKITGALLKAKGLRKGLPDYTIGKNRNIFIVNGNEQKEKITISFYLHLEAKTGKNKQTKEQIEFEERTKNINNEMYRVVRSIEDVEKALDEFKRIST
ncbi:MAG: hypothetical protein LBS34_00235 [Rickettsiales bacterium]|jgi:hypothetical protein|nr:hypothetical protein [Rickettsiales bacterium]